MVCNPDFEPGRSGGDSIAAHGWGAVRCRSAAAPPYPGPACRGRRYRPGHEPGGASVGLAGRQRRPECGPVPQASGHLGRGIIGPGRSATGVAAASPSGFHGSGGGARTNGPAATRFGEVSFGRAGPERHLPGEFGSSDGCFGRTCGEITQKGKVSPADERQSRCGSSAAVCPGSFSRLVSWN